MGRTLYHFDQFIDRENRCHHFILAAVITDSNTPGEFQMGSARLSIPERSVHFGLSITHPNDERDVVIGQRIAEGRAKKEKTRLGRVLTDQKGLLCTKVVTSILKEKAKHIKENPGEYIRGYDSQKRRVIVEKCLQTQSEQK
ncbi:MAG: hypothetical protein Nk1A_9170 [Endomicrobiia bacterium]|nr:MAG: hypothetical protein Nk1A_9170 [Endomicrobiia bacterium]